ncbi:hypothetical protein SAMN04488527_1646 [Aliiroseovarius crassostreae]|uniref:Uncharacterized protein n=1 Tax=Aliiroseovarius crassostreae TaxID=154981 RepID=A0A0P7IWA4_9RHOB|nr:hypothetical protein [Aliiroseovarius crassostreae]KPN62914.1 hypothetical protein AKJ29_01855 [Aliiroseovarius crassostreae]SFU97969.1 hypothetical protein SAMN04488527_1646 [Aliiroseovarius crassostreae]
MTIEDVLSKMKAEDTGDMWQGRAINLLEALVETDIDLAQTNDDLLNSMEAGRENHPQIDLFLSNLPGYPNNREHALEMLGYLTMQLHAAAGQRANSSVDKGKSGVV